MIRKLTLQNLKIKNIVFFYIFRIFNFKVISLILHGMTRRFYFVS